MNTKHTPTPWYYAPDYEAMIAYQKGRSTPLPIADFGKIEHSAENAAFIVRACNAHDDLVYALAELQKEVKRHVGQFNVKKHYALMVADAVATKALAKAKG